MDISQHHQLLKTIEMMGSAEFLVTDALIEIAKEFQMPPSDSACKSRLELVAIPLLKELAGRLKGSLT